MIINDDILNWCKEYKGEKFHAALMDPPYHLTDIHLKELNFNRTENDKKRRQISSKGFMGKSWDGGDIAFRKETWEALKEHLHPGAFCFAFASTRGLHRMMCAIEDAGFVIHPTIFLYAFGSGLPKATRIDTQIQSKEEQEPFEYEQFGREGRSYTHNGISFKDLQIMKEGSKIKTTIPTDPIAKRWTGHRYGLQALKPAVEPIICFQKPYNKKAVDCIVETGAGALNIDGGRIKIDNNDKNRRPNGSVMQEKAKGGNSCFGASGRNADLNGDTLDISKGRWPSNLIIDKESAERFPMTADSKGGNGSKFNIKNRNALDKNSLSCNVNNGENGLGLGDSGSAARYFKNVEMKIDNADPVFYTSKVSKEERNKGCEKMELKEKFWHNNETRDMTNPKNYIGGEVHKVYAKNTHPTLKSIDLTTYLATLLLPPIEYAPRRILVPFAGAGSEMIGCLKAGWEEIVGIELTAEYIPIIEARFEYYRKQIKLEKEQQLFEPKIMESMNKINKQETLFE